MKLYKWLSKKHAWSRGESGVSSKVYGTYAEYVEHQKAKLQSIKHIDKKRERLISGLTERFKDIPQIRRGANALCLGARAGAEVEAFIGFGVFAIGIDLNPGPDNRFVVTGDFHHLQYADNSVDVIYTNSLDHAFDVEKILEEVRRVLKPSGVFIAELIGGSRDDLGRDPGYYASTWWDSVDQIVGRISATGFRVEKRVDFSLPFRGPHVVFAPISRTA